MPITDADRANYQVYLAGDETKTNIKDQLGSLPAGVELRDSFGIYFVTHDPKAAPKRQERFEIELGGPKFV